MKTNDRKQLYKRAIDKFKTISQVHKCIEEMAELTVELTKVLTGDGRENVCSEIADVEIMIEQIRLIFNNKKIDEEKEYKLKRLKLKLDNAEKKIIVADNGIIMVNNPIIKPN